MQTRLTDDIKATPEGKEADAILRSCVHCGFCLATCPTYQLQGDELDSPRGRIYLIKQMLEGQAVTEKTQLHLDRCLTCRACETTCPSGVRYGRLLDIGRGMVEQRVPRTPYGTLKRYVLRKVLPNRTLFNLLLKFARLSKPLLPANLKKTIPTVRSVTSPVPSGQLHSRTMLMLAGCVQPSLAPNTNHATTRILDRLGITVITEPQAGCCGALAYHLNAQEAGLDAMRHNIDAWWPYVSRTNNPVEAIIITASGCGVTVKDYGKLLQYDPIYADKAAKIASLTRDISEVIEAEAETLVALLKTSANTTQKRSIAFHSPCTLQHGMQIRGKVEFILQAAGFHLTEVADSHLCCGSAGTYSILQPELSRTLRDNKIVALTQEKPELVVTANIGCQMHLQGGTALPVRHWIELLDEVLDE